MEALKLAKKAEPAKLATPINDFSAKITEGGKLELSIFGHSMIFTEQNALIIAKYIIENFGDIKLDT